MRYENPQLQALLAADYVVGALRGPARRRFESLMRYRPGLRRQVQALEATLAPMALNLPPVTPPPEVWNGLEAARVPAGKHTPRRAASRLWQAVAAGLAAVALALAVVVTNRPAPPALPDFVSVLADETGQPVWLVTALDDGTLRIKPVNVEAPPADKDYELWLLPEGGAAPVSLGLLTPGEDTLRPIAPAVGERLPRAAGIAVSLEPAGGSPTGTPTGPVILVAPLITT